MSLYSLEMRNSVSDFTSKILFRPCINSFFFFQFKPNLTKTQPHISLVLLPRTPKFLGNAPVPQRQQVLKPAQIKILGSTPRQWDLSIRRTYQELRSVEKLVGLNGPMPVRSAGSEWTPGSLWQESLIAYTKHILMKWKIDLKKKLKLLFEPNLRIIIQKEHLRKLSELLCP